MEGKRIWIAGETGMVGQACLRRLENENCEIISAPHRVLDLTNQADTYQWIADNKPDIIVMAAGKVGGIGANAAEPAAFLHENLVMAQNVIHGAHLANVDRLLYLGSSCIYPKEAQQPIKEEALLSGPLEPTNEGYALAKIAGIKLCQFYSKQYERSYIAAMPTNLYGIYDHFDPEKSHVIPALLLKIHQAKISNAPEVKLWGTGEPLREFLNVDDCADGIIHLLQNYNDEGIVNIGSQDEVSITELASMIADIVGYKGVIDFDSSKPDGTMRKKLDLSKMNALGWQAEMPLKHGLEEAYQWFLENIVEQKAA
ncbi:MAG: GDP-L-fucose synthase [Alphaproteobacteria bacterium]|nr:GDP-L-fucose synthase [Alphaproteobacteria bacterium]